MTGKTIDEHTVVLKYVKMLEHRRDRFWYRTRYVPKIEMDLRPSPGIISHGFTLTQPEVDLLYGFIDGQKKSLVVAAEFKYIRLDSSGRLSHSFYEGLDEAIALLALGVDHVLLVHVFDEKIAEEVLMYSASLLSQLICSTGIPIGYEVYVAYTTKSEDPWISSYTPSQYDLTRLYLDLKPNPLLVCNEPICTAVKKNREALIRELELKSRR